MDRNPLLKIKEHQPPSLAQLLSLDNFMIILFLFVELKKQTDFKFLLARSLKRRRRV